MIITLEGEAQALSTVQKWVPEFRRERECLEDDPKSGHHETAITEENNAHVNHMVIND